MLLFQNHSTTQYTFTLLWSQINGGKHFPQTFLYKPPRTLYLYRWYGYWQQCLPKHTQLQDNCTCTLIIHQLFFSTVQEHLKKLVKPGNDILYCTSNTTTPHSQLFTNSTPDSQSMLHRQSLYCSLNSYMGKIKTQHSLLSSRLTQKPVKNSWIVFPRMNS